MKYKTVPLKQPLKQFQIDNCRQWVEALRSGKYSQIDGVLASENGSFCCLGVACEIKNMARVIQDDGILGFKYLNNINDSMPDVKYFKFTYGFDAKSRLVYNFNHGTHMLSELNDNARFDFNAIAFVIEAACINRVAIEFSYDRASKELKV